MAKKIITEAEMRTLRSKVESCREAIHGFVTKEEKAELKKEYAKLRKEYKSCALSKEEKQKIKERIREQQIMRIKPGDIVVARGIGIGRSLGDVGSYLIVLLFFIIVMAFACVISVAFGSMVAFWIAISLVLILTLCCALAIFSASRKNLKALILKRNDDFIIYDLGQENIVPIKQVSVVACEGVNSKPISSGSTSYGAVVINTKTGYVTRLNYVENVDISTNFMNTLVSQYNLEK